MKQDAPLEVKQPIEIARPTEKTVMLKAEASTIPSVEELKSLATEIAIEYDIPSPTLHNLIESESRWDTWAENAEGGDRGLVQISPLYFPEEHKRAYDWEFSMRFAAKLIKNDEEYLFTSCNCYQFAKYVSGIDFPRMSNIQPNTMPSVGSIAIFDYNGIEHIAVIVELNEAYFLVNEANYKPCKIGTRRVRYDDERLVGFWLPVK